jgi:hypothetical protein
VAFALVCLISASISIASLRAAEQSYDASRVTWSQLGYRASKFSITVLFDLELQAQPSAQVSRALIDPAEGVGLRPAGTEALLITLEGKGLGRRSELSLWLNPIDASSLQRTQFETGRRLKHHRQRTLRFTRKGVYSITRRPEHGESKQPYEQWSRVSEDTRRFPRLGESQGVVTEPTALFYVLSTAALDKPGDRSHVHVFSKNRVMRVELQVEEEAKIGVEYLEESAGGQRMVKGQVDVLRISLNGHGLDPETSGRDFQFLGLRGDVSVFLDKKLRVPVQFSGNIKYAGKGNVKLRRVVLR